MTRSSSPTVSVIIPVHNGERYLRETVKSVLGQTYEDVELIIVDDASTDDRHLLRSRSAAVGFDALCKRIREECARREISGSLYRAAGISLFSIRMMCGCRTPSRTLCTIWIIMRVEPSVDNSKFSLEGTSDCRCRSRFPPMRPRLLCRRSLWRS